MTSLGDTIRELMELRRLSGVKLAAGVGVSPTSISKILNNQCKPRQITLTRIIRELCLTPQEEQRVIRAFSGLADTVPGEPEQAPRPLPPDVPSTLVRQPSIPIDEIERVTRYLEVKSMSVAFQSDVEAVLKSLGLPYKKDFRADPFICDFLVDVRGKRIAVDCKYNVNRDWDRTYATVKLLKEHLPCDTVVIVIPYENALARNARADIESFGSRIISLENLIDFFRKTLKCARNLLKNNQSREYGTMFPVEKLVTSCERI